MAREYAKNWFSMWTDDDFTKQPVVDKLLYNALLGQPVSVLNYAGIQNLNFKRLRKAIRDGEHLAPEIDVKAALIRMERRRYVFSDDDTGECLIRSFIRRDEVHKQPNVMLSALRAASFVESPKLAAILLDELTSRIVLPDIKGDSPKANSLRDNLKRTQAAAIDHLRTLSQGVSEPFPEPFAEDFPEGLPKPLTEGLPRPAEIEPFTKPFTEGFATGLVEVEVEVSKSPTVGGWVGEAGGNSAGSAQPQPNPGRNEPPPDRCPKHINDTDPPNCGACGGHRRHREHWDAQQPNRVADIRSQFWTEVRAAKCCDPNGKIDDPSGRNALIRCPNHDWDVIAHA